MKIDGTAIAHTILTDLTDRIAILKNKDIIPHLAIILIGDDPASQTYVRRKIKKMEELGGKATLYERESRIMNHELKELIHQLNQDRSIHGIIVQRPIPEQIDEHMADYEVATNKDVDGFQEQSPYTMPLAEAVVEILRTIFLGANGPEGPKENFEAWLAKKRIIIIGKGKTGGGPTIDLLGKMGMNVHVIDSKTHNPREHLLLADIIISTVGKHEVLGRDDLKKGVILVGVGMHRGKDGKMYPDYNQEAIKDVASFYTPVPGGVGPVNVAMLLANVVIAATPQK